MSPPRIGLKTIYDMKILFESIADVKAQIGWLYASADFSALQTDLELATEDIAELIGGAVYQRALTAYGSDEATELDKELIRMFQLPIALFAYRSYAENADISHEADGRKVKIDKDSESLPWEWMIERDDAALLKKANKTVDRLIDFLDKNIADFSEWKESDQRRDMLGLFVRSAKQFDEIIPIDRSRVFYLRVLPFVRREDEELVIYLGWERYQELKKAMCDENETEEQQRIIGFCREVVVHRVMAKAVRRFALQVLPDSVVTKFFSERQTMKATQGASQEMIKTAESLYTADAERAINKLQQYLKRDNVNLSRYERKETDYTKEKFFTV